MGKNRKKRKKSINRYKYADIKELENRVRSFDSDAAADLADIPDYDGSYKVTVDFFMYSIKSGGSLKGFINQSGYSPDQLDGLKVEDTKTMAQDHLNKISKKTESIKKKVSHRGRKSVYSRERQDEVVKKWINKHPDDFRTLNVFLVDEFGEKDTSSFDPKPNISPSAFYNWRTNYLERLSKQ